MGAGVHDGIVRVVFRQVGIIRFAVEGELQHPCPGQADPVPEDAYVGRDQPQILGDKRQTAELPLHHGEEVGARARLPLAGLRRRCSGGHVPGSGEGAEMVEADSIHVSQKSAQTVDAPPVIGPTQGGPVILLVAGFSDPSNSGERR